MTTIDILIIAAIGAAIGVSAGYIARTITRVFQERRRLKTLRSPEYISQRIAYDHERFDDIAKQISTLETDWEAIHNA